MSQPEGPDSSKPTSAPMTGRRLSIVAFIVVTIVYLGIIQGLARPLTANIEVEYGAPTTIAQLWRSITLPVAVSLLFVYGIVAFLRWWRPVFVDDRPVQRWVLAVPTIMLVAIVAGTNYKGLADRGLAFTALLLLSVLMVGFAEEGMYRGLGVVSFRVNGFTEGKVALWTSVLFGLAHSANLFTEGPKALLQVLVTAVAGYFFYLIRRRSGGLLVPAVVHGLWDFGAISGSVVPNESYPLGTALFILTDIVLAILLLLRRHHIESEERPAGSPATA